MTDRYPFNNSETFIENEIEITSKYFDQIYILPCGLMVNTDTCRKVPQNVKIMPPACSDDIYKDKPSNLKKVLWGINNLCFWYVKCLFVPIFWKELEDLIKNKRINLSRILKIFRTLAPSLRNVKYYKKMLSDEKFTDVYVYSYWIEPTVLFVSKMISFGNIKKCICRTHRWDLYSEENQLNYLAFQKKIIEFVDRLYVISDDGMQYLVKKYPYLAEKIEVSRLGTKNHGINPKEGMDNIFVIVSCSNMILVKRVNLIIDALSKLKEPEKIKWIHFGGGQLAKQLIRYADKKLSGRIMYEFKGQVSNNEIMQFYKENHVDVFINVSSSEGIPVSIMEAISYGIPVIATDVGGTGEIVFHEKNGYLLKKDFDTDTLVEYIERFLKGEIEIDIVRENSRKIWKNKYFSDINYNCFYKDFLREDKKGENRFFYSKHV